ncbi:MAG: hypothetical protein HY259_10895 [Chloroflexi bacterium]|nr:hypothetical protein [Chloroflexota bacterium]MBI3733946.1 hypothetical protein [Chloroflexota bacterium]
MTAACASEGARPLDAPGTSATTTAQVAPITPSISATTTAQAAPNAPPAVARNVKFNEAGVAFSGFMDKTATFYLRATSDMPVQSVTLNYYYFSSVPYTQTITLDSPQKELDISISGDNDLYVFGDGLGRAVVYRWTLTDTSGAVSVSPRYAEVFKVRNSEYDWRVIVTDHFHVYYYGGGERLARDTIAPAAEDVYVPVTSDFGAALSQQVNIHVYATRADYLGDAAVKWSGGTATAFEMVLSPVSSLSSAKAVIAHELTHNVHNVVARSNKGPSWFLEGLAAYEESKVASTSYANELANSARRGALLPLARLESTTSQDAFVNSMVYAEGYGVIKYLFAQFGKEKFLSLLEEMGKAKSLDMAMRDVYGKGVAEIESDWRASLK